MKIFVTNVITVELASDYFNGSQLSKTWQGTVLQTFLIICCAQICI